MDQFDIFLTPNDIQNYSEHQINQYTCYMRLEVTEFILEQYNGIDIPNKPAFYDIESFYKKYNITNQDQKDKIRYIIITELKNLGWSIATLFEETALLIKKSETDIHESVWGSTIDLQIK